MSDDTTNDSSGLPPKISVRKAAPAPAPAPEASAPEAAPAAKPVPSAGPRPATGKPLARPKTIKAKPLAKPVAKPVSAPAATAETPAAPAQASTAKPAAPSAAAKKPAAAPIRPRTVVAKPVKASSGDEDAKTREGDPSAVRVAKKSETTKIPLDAARPKDAAPKTVKAAKPVAKPAAELKPEAEVSPEETTRQATAAASKRTTSRISLEAVLGAEDDSDSGGPKTIRLKRPGAAASGKVNTVTTVRKKPVPKTAATAAAASAAGKEDGAEGNAETTATQRKTVVVKKTGSKSVRKKVSVSRAGGEAAGTSGPGPAAASVKKKTSSEPGWVFAVYSLAAVLLTCVLIYVITAQVVGPNASLTEYSYAKTGPELPWSGRLAGPRSY